MTKKEAVKAGGSHCPTAWKAEDEALQKRLHAEALKFVSAIPGGNPARAEEVPVMPSSA